MNPDRRILNICVIILQKYKIHLGKSRYTEFGLVALFKNTS